MARKTNLTLSVRPELVDRLRALSAAEGRSISDWVGRILTEYVSDDEVARRAALDRHMAEVEARIASGEWRR